MDWITALTLIFGSSLISTLVTKWIDASSDSKKKSDYNKFVALSLSQNFEDYSWQCAETLEDHKLSVNSHGSSGKEISYPPEKFEIPKESYKHFDISLLDRVFGFTQMIRSSKSQIHFWYDVCGTEEAIDSACKETARLGKEALIISEDIRKKYDLASRHIELGETNLHDYFKEESNK